MSEMTVVALDAMGGDNAPGEMIKGAVEAVRKRSDMKVLLVGKQDLIEEALAGYTYPKEQIEVVHASEVIETAEPPVLAIRRKKDSSLVKAMQLVKNKEADALVSAGSSGAILVGGQVLVGGSEPGAVSPVDPDGKGNVTFDRLRGKCRCQTGTSCPVRKDGFYLYGTCDRKEESDGRDRQHRSGGRKRKCAREGDVPASESVQRYQLCGKRGSEGDSVRSCGRGSL